ncbi:MAG: HD domain-containing protein [Caldilineaceae bacterium]
MDRADVFRIIHKYIPPDGPTYPLYVIHCMLVARKAVAIGQYLGLGDERITFLEEAAMLHDIGIGCTNTPELYCTGTLPYMCHIVEGAKILEAEGLPRHARIAERHANVTKADILQYNLPLPARDLTCETVEEEIISFADCFYSKVRDDLWHEKSLAEIRHIFGRYGARKQAIIEDWIERFYVEPD